MNLTWLKLAFAALWLLPGFGLLVYEAVTGQIVAVPILGRRLNLVWPCLAFGLYNLATWFVLRANRRAAGATGPLPRRARRSRDDADDEPDPNFRFDE